MEDQFIRLFLYFKDEEPPLRLEITECVKFDASDFTIEQQGLGRDVLFGNEEVSLFFYQGVFEPSDATITMPDSTTVNFRPMGFEHLIQALQTKGFEIDVELIVNKNGLDFTTGKLLFVTTDLSTFVECKTVLETKRAEIKRRNETKIDVYSDKDLAGNDIEPLVPFDVLFKAKSEYQASKWEQYGVFISRAGIVRYLNTANNLSEFGVQDSLVAFDMQMSGLGEDIFDAANNFRYILAQNNLSGITINYNVNVDFLYRVTGGDSGSAASMTLYYSFYEYPYDPSTGAVNSVYTKELTGDTDQDFHLEEVITFTIPPVPSGLSVGVFWAFEWGSEHLGSDDARTRWIFNSAEMEIDATSTAFNSVVKMCWYRDVFKQVVKSINGMTCTMPRFEEGGEFGKLALTNGWGVRQFPGKPFYNTWKELTEGGLPAFFGGTQITPATVFIGRYPDFYANREIAVFLQVPGEDFRAPYNEDAQINTIDAKFKNFETDRNELNTTDSIHKELQGVHPNRMNKKALKIEIDPVYDACLWESTRKQSVMTTSSTTALTVDEKPYLAELIEIEADATETITAKLFQRTNSEEYQLEILNGTLEQSGYFNWTLQGLSVGSEFIITSGVNSGTYTVVSITPTVLTIQGISAVEQAEDVISATFPLTGIMYTNRTTEDIETENISNPQRFSNLRYSLAEIIRKYYGQHLKMCSKFHPDGVINISFSGNGEATIIDEGITYKQNAPIVIADLPDAILSPVVYKTKVVAQFEEVLDLLEKMNEINEDGSIGGYIKVLNSIGEEKNIHPIKLNYVWVEGILTIEGEVRE